MRAWWDLWDGRLVCSKIDDQLRGSPQLKETDCTEPWRGDPIVAVGTTHGKDYENIGSEDPGGA